MKVTMRNYPPPERNIHIVRGEARALARTRVKLRRPYRLQTTLDLGELCIGYHCDIVILRDVYVLDITVNFMLNKRKSKKAAGVSPLTPLGELSALPQPPLPYLPPVVNVFIRHPLSQNPGSAPGVLYMGQILKNCTTDIYIGSCYCCLYSCT